MKKKTIIILVISIIAFVCVWAIAYHYASSRISDIERRGYIEDARAFLSNDSEFLQKYGNIISFESNDDGPIASGRENEYYMDFHCITDKENFYIRVYSVYNDGWSFYYIVM